MDLFYCMSRCVEERNFFNDQRKLDTTYYLMKGLTYRQVAEKIGKQISYVQRVMDFLKTEGLLFWGRWAPNVYKIGMKKSIVFLDWEDREVPEKKNFNYTTYVHHVKAEGAKVFVVYTYPKNDEEKIKGDWGEEVTPFYYTYTRFTTPFFKKVDDLVFEFFDIYYSVKNDEKILSGTPTFDPRIVYDDPKIVHDDPRIVYTCRYGEILPDLTPGVLTERLEQDFNGCEIDVSYEKVRTILNNMKQGGVIFPKNVLFLKPLYYQAVIVRIETKEIYKIMETFNQFNMLTRVALTRNPEIFYLYLQYPFYQFSEVMEILCKLDPDHKAYIETKFIMGDTIYYQWSLDKFKKSGSADR